MRNNNYLRQIFLKRKSILWLFFVIVFHRFPISHICVSFVKWFWKDWVSLDATPFVRDIPSLLLSIMLARTRSRSLRRLSELTGAVAALDRNASAFPNTAGTATPPPTRPGPLLIRRNKQLLYHGLCQSTSIHAVQSDVGSVRFWI